MNRPSASVAIVMAAGLARNALENLSSDWRNFASASTRSVMSRALMTIAWTLGSFRRLVPVPSRSEEHTSELQSRLHLVCRLLLEKKKNHTHPRYRYGRPALTQEVTLLRRGRRYTFAIGRAAR